MCRVTQPGNSRKGKGSSLHGFFFIFVSSVLYTGCISGRHISKLIILSDQNKPEYFSPKSYWMNLPCFLAIAALGRPTCRGVFLHVSMCCGCAESIAAGDISRRSAGYRISAYCKITRIIQRNRKPAYYGLIKVQIRNDPVGILKWKFTYIKYKYAVLLQYRNLDN